MFAYTSYLANKLIDQLMRGVAYTFPTTGLSVGLLVTTKGPRANSTAYALNDTMSLVANDGNTHLYKCTTAGTSAAAQSTLYPGTDGEAITDGTAVFQEQAAALRAGTAAEAAWTNYARANLAASTANWAATNGAGTTTNPSSGTGQPITSNNSTLTFGTAVGSGPNYVWAFALFDAASAGNRLAYAPLSTPKTVNNGDGAPSFAAGQAQFYIDR